MAIRCTWPLRRLRRPPRLRYRPLSAVPRGWWAEHLPRRSPVGGRRAKAARFDSLTSRAANWRRRSPHSVTWHPDSALCWPINWRSPNGRYTPHHHPATTNSHLIFFWGGGLSKSNRISFSHRKKTLLSGRNEISEIYRVKTFFKKNKIWNPISFSHRLVQNQLVFKLIFHLPRNTGTCWNTTNFEEKTVGIDPFSFVCFCRSRRGCRTGTFSSIFFSNYSLERSPKFNWIFLKIKIDLKVTEMAAMNERRLHANEALVMWPELAE